VPLNSKTGFGGISTAPVSAEDASGCGEQNTPSGTSRRLCSFYRIGRYAGSVMVERGVSWNRRRISSQFLFWPLFPSRSGLPARAIRWTRQASIRRKRQLVSTIADILGLDQAEVGDYLQGHRSEICYGAVVVRSE